MRPSSHKSAAPSPEPADLEDELAEGGAEFTEESLPRMTIAEKLDMARAEAEEVAAAKSKSSKTSSQQTSRLPRPTAVCGESREPKIELKGSAAFGLDGAGDSERDDTLGKLMPSPMAKKTKIRGRPKRRKSTLSPEELEELIAAGEG